MPDYRLLEAHEAVRCTALTYPAYHHLLQLNPTARHPEEIHPRLIQPIAIAAIEQNAVAGLALAEIGLEGTPAPELLSLYIVPEMRRRGIGSALVATVEQEIARRGHRTLDAVFMIGKPGIDTFKRIIARRQWSDPAVRMVSVRFDFDVLVNAPWMHEHADPPPEYEVFLWSDLTAAELQQMKETNAEKQWISPDLQPWDYMKHGYDEATSIGLRYKGDVAGWVINHRFDDETLRYTCSFLRKDVSRLGRIVTLYAGSMHRARAAGYRRGMFVTPLHHRGMAGFARRRFGPWSDYVGVTEGASKKLEVQNERTEPTATLAGGSV